MLTDLLRSILAAVATVLMVALVALDGGLSWELLRTAFANYADVKSAMAGPGEGDGELD